MKIWWLLDIYRAVLASGPWCLPREITPPAGRKGEPSTGPTPDSPPTTMQGRAKSRLLPTQTPAHISAGALHPMGWHFRHEGEAKPSPPHLESSFPLPTNAHTYTQPTAGPCFAKVAGLCLGRAKKAAHAPGIHGTSERRAKSL